MSSIDQRVVQMEFDNKQFEKGIQTTLKSLEELQKGLDLKGATNGIKNIEKSVNNMDVSGIAKTVESIASHFTWLGRTVDHIIDNLTTRLINLGTNFVKDMSINQVTAGWDKYGEKVKSVATIMNATGLSIDEVNQHLEKLNWFTDETSYNFTDMVNNIGKFTAVDVPLADAVTAMQGIANAAALSGQGVNEASRAMYNFSQAMGTGALLLQDWKSIELANMATTEFKNQLIQSGLAVGTLVKQGDKFVTTTKDGTGSIQSFTSASEGFRDSLSARWITTDVMMDTFKKYGQYADEIYKITEREGITAAEAMERFSDSSMDLGERAFKAAQEYRTFTDAIMATKDAVSTGWMQSFEIIFGDYEKAKSLWTSLGNTLWDVFASGTDARNQMLKDVFQNQEATLNRKDWLNLVKQGIADDAFEKALTDAARTHGVAIDEMIEKNGTFYDSLKENWLTVDILNEALDTTKKSADGAASGVEASADRLKELESVAKKVIQGDFGNGEVRMKALADAGYDYAEVQTLVNKILKGGSVTLEDLSDAELEQIGYTKEEIEQLNKLKKQAEETGTPLNDLIQRMTKPTGRDLMVETAANAFEALMRVIRAVKYAWLDIFPPMTSDRLYSILEGIRDFSKNLIFSSENAQRFRRIFAGVFGLFDIFGQVISSVAQVLGGIGKSLLPIGETILEGSAKVGDAIKALSKGLRESGVFQAIVQGVLGTLSAFTDKISEIVTSIRNSFDFGDVFEPIRKVWNNFGTWIESKGGISGILSNFFTNLQEMIRGLDAGKISQSILNFVDRIKEAFSSLDGLKNFIVDIFRNIFSFFSNLGKEAGSNLEGSNFSFLDKIVNFLATPFELIGKIGDSIKPILNTIGSALQTGFGWIETGLSIAVDIINKYLTPILSFFRSVTLLNTLRNVNELIDTFDTIFNKVAKVIGSVRGIFNEVGAGIKRITKAKAKDLSANAFLKVAGAIAILVGSVYVLTKLDPNQIYEALTVIGLLFAELAGGLYLFNQALGGNAAGGVKKISGFLSLALSVMVFVNVMQKLLKMKISDIAISLLELSGILVILAGFARLAGSSFKASSGAALLMTALALQGFILAIVEISHMDVDAALQGILGIGAILTQIGIFTKIAGTGFKFTNGAALLLTAISLQGFVLAILEIGKMKPENALGGVIALGAIVIQLGAFMRLAGGKFKLQNGAALVAVALSMVIFAQTINKLGSIKTGTLVKGIIGLGVVFLEIKSLMKSAQGMSLGAGIGFGMVMVSLFALIPILKEMSKLPNVEKVGVAFGAAVAGLGVGLGALSKIGFKGGLSAGGALASFTLIVGAVIAVIEAIAGAVAKIPSIDGFLGGATSVLGQVGDAIGAFLGGIIGGITQGTMDAVSAGLSGLGTALSDFWTNAGNFIEGAKSIDGDTLAGVGYLAEAILKLTGADLLEALAGWISGGEVSIEKFGLELAKASPWIAIFANVLGGVSKDKIDKAVSAMTALATIDISRSGGWLQTVIGEKDFANFGNQLALLAPGLVEFSNKTADLNVTNCENAAKAIKALAQIDVSNTGGLWQGLIGENSLGNFGDNLGALGSGIAAFATATQNVDADGISKILPAIPAIQALASLNVSNTGGAFQWLVGINDLGNFGEDMEDIGEGLERFAVAVKDVDAVQLGAVVTQLQALADFSNSLSGMITTNIADFTTALELLGGVDFDPLLESFAGYSTDFASSGTDLAAALVGAMTETLYKAKSPINAFDTIITSMADSVDTQGKAQSYMLVGQTLATNLASGITGQTDTLHRKVLDLMTNGLSAINATRTNFKNSGANVASGLVEGMKSKVTDLTNAAKMLANSANKAFQNTLKIKSPSRVMQENGSYFVQGFIQGLQNSSDSVEEAASSIGTISVDALQSAMAMVSAMMNSEGDLAPTIRPVLDLSAVQSGAGQISSIFGQTQTIGLGGYQNPFIPKTLDTISASMSPLDGETVATDNDDVVMAIQTLGDQFETLKEAVTNMKLVMESGAVVGQIKYEIDRQLGRMAELKGRGI